MNNDLISRERLKNTILLGNYDTRSKILSAIDNAPTVTNGTYEQGFRVGAYGRLNEIRPQGEWKEFKYGLYYCSRCFERVDKDIERIESLVSKGERSNYCPACGAKMGGTT